MNKVMFSSKSNQWATPRPLFDWLNVRFQFTLDPCATVGNALCSKFFTVDTDGLTQSWHGERVFMNPPYGRQIGRWVRKAAEEAKAGALVVGLLPARTDTAWWHDFVVGGADILFLRGRLKFGSAMASAPFPSAIATWWGQNGKL